MVQRLMNSLPLRGRLLVTIVGLHLRDSEVQRTAAQSIYRRR